MLFNSQHYPEIKISRKYHTVKIACLKLLRQQRKENENKNNQEINNTKQQKTHVHN